MQNCHYRGVQQIHQRKKFLSIKKPLLCHLSSSTYCEHVSCSSPSSLVFLPWSQQLMFLFPNQMLQMMLLIKHIISTWSIYKSLSSDSQQLWQTSLLWSQELSLQKMEMLEISSRSHNVWNVNYYDDLYTLISAWDI